MTSDNPADQPDADRELDRGTVLALGAMALSVFLIANDFTALSVALPNIEREFDSDVSTVQWVINGYALVFGVFIVTGGRLADMFGRRRLFFVGAAIFAAFSAVAAIAPSLWMLLGARALMGVGGAIMWPAVLGMTFALLPARKAGLAGGLILGVAGLGNAFGPLLGGFLTEVLSWRWVFAINLPVAAGAAFVTWRHVRQPADRDAGARVDVLGVATLTVALVALLLALDEVTALGWGDPPIVALLALFVAAMVAFVLVERRMGENALVPRDVMGNTEFTAACVAVLFTAATFFASLLYLPQFFQKLLDYGPLEAGLALVPLMATFALVSFVAGGLYERLGAKPILSTGVALMFAGILLLSLVGAGAGYAATVPGMLDPRLRLRPVHLDDHDGGGDLARRVAGEPRRRDPLHVPGGRRVGRPRADHDDLHERRRGPAVHRHRRGRAARGRRGGPRRPGHPRRDRLGRTGAHAAPGRRTSRSPSWSATRSSRG